MILVQRGLSIAIALFWMTSFAQADSSLNFDAYEKANEFYDQGNCVAALELFIELLPSPEHHDEALFKKAICDLKLNNYTDARRGFAQVLKKSPKNDEARLKYAETLHAERHYETATRYALGVRDPMWLIPARVLAAQSLIEQSEYEKAIEVLNEIRNPSKDWLTVIEYWKGFAYHQLFDDRSAGVAFNRSQQTSPNTYWTKSASDQWLQSLKETRHLLHTRLNLGYGFDSNVTQANFIPQAGSAPDSSYTLQDAYQSLELNVFAKTFDIQHWLTTPSFNFSAWFYNNDTTYNPAYSTFQLSTVRSLGSRWSLRSSLSFFDVRYHWAYSQDYLIFNPSIFYSILRVLSVHFNLGITHDVFTHNGWTLSPSIGIDQQLDILYWLANITFTSSTETSTSFTTTSGVTTVLDGVLNSHYRSLQARVAMGTKPWSSSDAFLQLVYTSTQYDTENAPSGSAFNLNPRADQNWTLGLVMTQNLGPPTLNFVFNSSLSVNSSQGFQGLLYSNGYSPDYNYQRWLNSLALSYTF